MRGRRAGTCNAKLATLTRSNAGQVVGYRGADDRGHGLEHPIQNAVNPHAERSGKTDAASKSKAKLCAKPYSIIANWQDVDRDLPFLIVHRSSVPLLKVRERVRLCHRDSHPVADDARKRAGNGEIEEHVNHGVSFSCAASADSKLAIVPGRMLAGFLRQRDTVDGATLASLQRSPTVKRASKQRCRRAFSDVSLSMPVTICAPVANRKQKDCKKDVDGLRANGHIAGNETE